MIKTLLILLLLFPVPLAAQSDLNVSVGNYFRYGTGTDGFLGKKRDYVENFTDARISMNEFLVGFRLLHDAPPEYGVEFSGIKKRFIEFKRDDLYIRGGDSYSLFARGLALNLFENRSLAFDNGLDGLKLHYETDHLRLTATGGTIRYFDQLTLDRTEHYDIRAGSIEYLPFTHLRVGASFVSGHFKILDNFPDQRSQFDIPELFGKLQFRDFDLFMSYIEKRTTTFDPDPIFGPQPTHKGTAFYGAMAYTGSNFGFSFEYKDYRLGITNPYERTNYNRATKAFAFQNPPTVHKEHSFTLLTRYPHVIDISDEVGYQVDVFYTVGEKFIGTINASAASRHYIFRPTGDTSKIFIPIFGSTAREKSFLPSFDNQYSPFWEIYADWMYYLDEIGLDYVQIAINRRSSVFANELTSTKTLPAKTEATRTTSIPMVVQYSFQDGWSGKASLERQWVYEQKNFGGASFSNILLSVTVSKSPTYSVTIRHEFSSDGGTVDGRRDWSAIDFSYKLGEKHNITLTGGQDRGGQNCANGVCRVANPFMGVRAGIVSYF